MKRLVILTCMAGVAGWLTAGCGQQTPPAAARKRATQSTNRVATAKATPVKALKAEKKIVPGTIDYLDSKNGFRDVTFGQSDSAISDLVVKSQDDARQLKTGARSGDNMSLHGVPVTGIEYNFHRGQLYSVQIKWKLEHPENTVNQPPTTDLSVACAREYGTPRLHRIGKDGTEFAWRGRKVEVILTESLLPGVPNLVKGGWVLLPTTIGQMTIRNISLARVAEAGDAAPPKQNSAGL